MMKTIEALVNGESVCIYCMPGAGKIYFLKQAQKILGEFEEIKVFFFEGQVYTSGLYKSIKQTLIRELRFQQETDFFQQLEKFLQEKKIVIILGHVEIVFAKQKKALEFLFKLRDFYPTRLSVLSSCDHSVIRDFPQYSNLGGTLFSNLIKIPPFDLAGTKRILEVNHKVLGYQFSSSAIKKIHRLSGGNPSLIKHLEKCVDELGEQVLTKQKILTVYPSLRIKLNDINEVILSETKEVLIQIGIINEKGKLFSPLTAEYLKKYELESIEEIVPGLTPQEKKILTFFLKNKGKIVTKDRIFMLMELSEENYSLWAIYKAISRLKNKIEGKYQLRALKNRGYFLASASLRP